MARLPGLAMPLCMQNMLFHVPLGSLQTGMKVVIAGRQPWGKKAAEAY